MTTASMSMLDIAHQMLDHGLRVFPLDHPDQPHCIGKHGPTNPCDGSRGKHPAVKWGTWAVAATHQMLDLEVGKHGGIVNLGIACGPSNLVAFDEDKYGEIDKWAVTYGISLPDTWTVTTGRGEHRIYTWNHSQRPIGNTAKALKGFKVDIRGDGGYIVAEHSRHASGTVYSGNGLPIAPLPPEVADLLVGTGKTEQPPSGPSEPSWENVGAGNPDTDKIPDTERHNALIAYAGRLRNSGLDYSEVEDAFRRRWLLCEQPTGQIPEATFHSSTCRFPVTWDEAKAKLHDVYHRYPPGQAPGIDGIDGAVEHRLTLLRINREAQRRLDAENRPPAVPPPVKSLTELLAEPDDPVAFRIDKVALNGGNTMLTAQFKAGKTTLTGNLTRALVDGDPFLGTFTVAKPAKALVIADIELSQNTSRRWLRDQGIRNTDAVADVVSLRGNVAAFNPLDEDSRRYWSTRLRDLGCDYFILDCLRPVLDALGLDENRDVGKFLVAFDRMLADAGVADSLIVQHMGHGTERGRGDSRQLDWPDATWTVLRETDKPDSPRYFSAFGRDVNVPEGRLTFDPTTRRLIYAAGSRSDAKTERALPAILATLAGSRDGMSGRTIEEAATAGGHKRDAIRAALKKAVDTGLLAVDKGAHNSNLHRIAHPCAKCGYPVVTGDKSHQSCPNPGDEGLFQ